MKDVSKLGCSVVLEAGVLFERLLPNPKNTFQTAVVNFLLGLLVGYLYFEKVSLDLLNYGL